MAGGKNRFAWSPGIQLVLASQLLCSQIAALEVVQHGVLYEGGTRLEAPDVGVAFTVPEDWQAMWPAGSEFMVMQPADTRVTILATVEEASPEEIRATMAAPIELGDGIVLHPAGGIESRSGVLEASYRVTGAPIPLVARGAARASGGVTLAFVLAAPAEMLDQHLGTLDRMIAGATIEVAPPSRQTDRELQPNASGIQPGANPSGDRWDTYLAGKYIVRYYTTTGYTDETHLWLCSDGVFYRRGAAGGFGGGASGAFQGDATGSWQASGAGANGALTLRYGDGSVAHHDLRWDYDENHLYVDGKRWLHGENERCR